MIVDSLTVLDVKADVFDTVTVCDQMRVHLLATVLVVDRRKDEGGSLVVSNHMTNNFPLSGFKSPVSKVLEAESGCVVRSGLLGISDPKCNMAYMMKVVPKLRILPKAGRGP